METHEYGHRAVIDTPFEEAITKVTEELKKEGFGVLTEIDVTGTLKKKLDVDFKNYRILGACNPPFAYKALQAMNEIGLLLPCNVVVYEDDGKTVVSAIDPISAMSVTGSGDLATVAKEVDERLRRVVQAMEG